MLPAKPAHNTVFSVLKFKIHERLNRAKRYYKIVMFNTDQ